MHASKSMEAESSSPEFFDAQDWDDMSKRSEKDLKVEEGQVKMMNESIGRQDKQLKKKRQSTHSAESSSAEQAFDYVIDMSCRRVKRKR